MRGEAFELRHDLLVNAVGAVFVNLAGEARAGVDGGSRGVCRAQEVDLDDSLPMST
jgi:hypothetical protein